MHLCLVSRPSYLSRFGFRVPSSRPPIPPISLYSTYFLLPVARSKLQFRLYLNWCTALGNISLALPRALELVNASSRRLRRHRPSSFVTRFVSVPASHSRYRHSLPLSPSSVRIRAGCRRRERFGLCLSFTSVNPAGSPPPTNSHGLGSVQRHNFPKAGKAHSRHNSSSHVEMYLDFLTQIPNLLLYTNHMTDSKLYTAAL
ncbi:hypothetical protein EDB89DRAFT_649597 [Lactarius sanguifluus]|nr:hypothetical protein EDB89DRAFT_649597 [Lactarius sanguifluus]